MRSQIAGAMAGQIFLDHRPEALRRSIAVFSLILFPTGVDLWRSYALCNRASWRDCPLAPEGDKTHFQRGHFRPRPQAHRIACACIKGTVPHLVAGSAGMVGLIKTCRAARSTDNRLGGKEHDFLLLQVNPPGPAHLTTNYKIIHDIDMILDFDI